MTVKETEEYILKRILVQYSFTEAKSVAKMVLQHVLKLDNVHYALKHSVEVPSTVSSQIHEFINKLQWGEPIQYIIGESHFMGFDFMVSPDVLIPRRETEELVDLIRRENPNPLTLLDIGTGSGCIAIALQKLLNQSKVYAMDVSENALLLANRNAQRLHAEVIFMNQNILETDTLAFDTLDVIVSNPPYVTEKEKAKMHVNVLHYEPHLALFVPDDDALLFYRKIVLLASKSLKINGKLYFEINENYGDAVSDLMIQSHFHSVEVVNDMQGKNRIVKGIL